jgi:hypothetical protein
MVIAGLQAIDRGNFIYQLVKVKFYILTKNWLRRIHSHVCISALEAGRRPPPLGWYSALTDSNQSSILINRLTNEESFLSNHRSLPKFATGHWSAPLVADRFLSSLIFCTSQMLKSIF